MLRFKKGFIQIPDLIFSRFFSENPDSTIAVDGGTKIFQIKMTCKRFCRSIESVVW